MGRRPGNDMQKQNQSSFLFPQVLLLLSSRGAPSKWAFLGVFLPNTFGVCHKLASEIWTKRDTTSKCLKWYQHRINSSNKRKLWSALVSNYKGLGRKFLPSKKKLEHRWMRFLQQQKTLFMNQPRFKRVLHHRPQSQLQAKLKQRGQSFFQLSDLSILILFLSFSTVILSKKHIMAGEGGSATGSFSATSARTRTSSIFWAPDGSLTLVVSQQTKTLL